MFKYICSLRYVFRKRVLDRKTVFVLISSLSGGGAERVGTVLASELSADYHVVILYTYKSKAKVCYQLSPDVDLMCVPFFFGQKRPPGKMLTGLIRLLKKRQNAYVSISLTYNPNIINVGSRANDKIICSERNSPLKHWQDSFRFDKIQSIYEQADHVVFQSSVVRDVFNKKIQSHCSILPNPVGVSCLRKPETEHRIVTCGRLHPQKNQELLIRAFYQFRNIHPEYTLSIYGEGELRLTLQDLIQSLNLQDSVRLEGRSPHVHEDIADAEIFVLSSDYEGLSNALLEAMMMGFPCISTDCEGSTDVIENDVNGLLVSRGSEEELLSAMLLMAEHEAEREEMGRKAMQTAERFKREKVVEEWRKLIETV